MRRKELTACRWCGRPRVVNSARGTKDACASCRHFARSEPTGEWITGAACAGVDPELFFADDSHNDYATAIQICSGCPVINDCLDYAVSNNIRDGVWGGLTGNQRRNLTRAT